jgi:hypothetical protein
MHTAYLAKTYTATGASAIVILLIILAVLIGFGVLIGRRLGRRRRIR